MPSIDLGRRIHRLGNGDPKARGDAVAHADSYMIAMQHRDRHLRLMPGSDDRPVHRQHALDAQRRMAAYLLSLNAALVRCGHDVGEQVAVYDRVFLVGEAGEAAAFLGYECPDDSEAEPSLEDELGQSAWEYAQMVHVGGVL